MRSLDAEDFAGLGLRQVALFDEATRAGEVAHPPMAVCMSFRDKPYHDFRNGRAAFSSSPLFLLFLRILS